MPDIIPKEVIENIKNDPVQSNRIIARKAGSDDKTVGTVRRKLETTAEIPQLKKRTGADGKVRKADPIPKTSKKSTGEIPQFKTTAAAKKAPALAKVQIKRDRSFESEIMSQINAYAKELSFGDRAQFKDDLMAFAKKKL